MKPRDSSTGLIDVAFAGPELRDKDKTPDLPDLLKVFNLHGNALDEGIRDVQFEFLRKFSDVIVVFPESVDCLKQANFTKDDPPILVIHDFDADALGIDLPSYAQYSYKGNR